MKIADITYAPTYFDKYISQVGDLHLSEAFEHSLAAIDALDLGKIRAIGDQVYAPGKWTLKNLFQHLSDCERVFAYRALRFGRNDKTQLPGFDEDLFAENAGTERRTLEDILSEMRGVRVSTQALFNAFDETALRRTGIMFNAELPVLAVGFTLIGHQIHHFRIMEERYFPLLQTA